ncbi:unnamed protein product, partial [Medioppia subpectinata]
QQHKHHKRKLKKLQKSDSNSNNSTTPTSPPNGYLSVNNDFQINKSDNYLKPDSHAFRSTVECPPNDSEDGGIEFTARKVSPDSSLSKQSSDATATRASTTAESTLPWRRDSPSNPELFSAQVIRQEEFPPWIDNKDYLPQYASPTNTYLAKLSDQPKSEPSNRGSVSPVNTRTPTVYEIFTIDESRENGGRSDSASSQGSRDKSETKRPDGQQLQPQPSEGVTRGRFHCTSATTPQDTDRQLSPTIAVNLGFESDDDIDDKDMVYKL